MPRIANRPSTTSIALAVMVAACASTGPDQAGVWGSDQASLTTADTGATEDAFRNHSSGVMVTAEGSVDRVLSDDAQGSRHQRFILRLASGQSILVAHNIDLAGRVPIAVGSRLKLHGEYEWNDRGGVVHWTHRDPAHKHEAGWIETGGRRYE